MGRRNRTELTSSVSENFPINIEWGAGGENPSFKSHPDLIKPRSRAFPAQTTFANFSSDNEDTRKQCNLFDGPGDGIILFLFAVGLFVTRARNRIVLVPIKRDFDLVNEHRCDVIKTSHVTGSREVKCRPHTNLLTPTWCWNDEAGDHLLADDGRLRRRRRTHQAVDDVVGGPQDPRQVRRFGPRRPHHHAQRQLFLEDALQVHHVQIGHDGPVDHHDLVALDYTWTGKLITIRRRRRRHPPFCMATLLSSTRLT